MALSTTARKLAQALDVSEFRIRRPSSFVFLCGGALNPHNPKPASIREHLLRSCPERLLLCNDVKIMLAENVNQSFSNSRFEDLFLLESYIASLSELTPLILESPGSIAELGAFSQIPEISERLFVIAKNGHHPFESFISLGPLRNLAALYKHRKVISVHEWTPDPNGPTVDGEVITEIREEIIELTRSRSKSEKFNPIKLSHISILILHLIYFCRGATTKDIEECLMICGVNVGKSDINLHLNALEIVGWARQDQERNLVCWIPKIAFQMSDIAYIKGHPNDTPRWISDISEEYKVLRDPRFKIGQRLAAARS